MSDSSPSPDSNPSDAPVEANSVLADSLEKRKPRFFRAAGGSARGRSGREDTERFAEELMTLQECAQIIGERLEMNAIAFGAFYDNSDTSAFRYDPGSDPRTPELVGALVNRRMPMRELLNQLNDFMNE